MDHINIIRENDGRVRFESVVIPKDIELLAELEAMVDNPNRTVIDMQNRMALFFNVNNRRSYNYIYPYSYASSYVDGVSYPQSMTLDEYHNMIAKIEVDLKERNYSSDVYTEKLSGAIRDKKSRYMTAARRYVNAYSYYNQITSFLSDASVKMYSTETIGWSSFSFDISDDVKINVRSNFGYGWSSYFFVNLTYKGIEIHPYSYWIKYYNADKESLMRYTRNYETDSKSWESAFKFVEDVTNKAKNNEGAFVKEFILNEVDELMRGLRTIMKMPMDYLTKCYEQRFHKPETNIIGIWHGSDDFGEWLEYLNGIDEYEAFQDYLEFLEEEEEEYPDDLLIPTLSDESIASLKTVAAGAFQEIERSFADMSTDQKLSSLDELMDLNRKRLLFDYIKQDDEFGFNFIFDGRENASFAESGKRALTYTNLKRIYDMDEFNSKDPELKKSLEFYDSVIHNESWCEKQMQRIDQWMNCDTGSSQAVYAKCLNRSFQDLRERIVQEPEIKKTKVRTVDYSVDR